MYRYYDDIGLATTDEEQHVYTSGGWFSHALREVSSINFLGHFYLSKKHGSLSNTLLDIKFPCPLIVKELQVHLGMVNFYLCFLVEPAAWYMVGM
jgi:hypothetical protein